MGRIFAAADIGSNTIHLLIAETTRTGVRRLYNESDWLSLGEVVSREGKIPEPLIERLLTTMAAYKAAILTYKAQDSYVFATEAMRVAANHEEVIKRIRVEVGIPVDLISPSREAELSYQGIQLDCSGAEPMVLIEVGGGSAQLAWCDHGTVQQSSSLALGTGRLISDSGLTYPCPTDALDRLASLIRGQMAALPAEGKPQRVVACGGVARGIWRAIHPDGYPEIHRQELEYVAWSAARLPIDKVAQRFNVKSKRAATLVPGSKVFLEILNRYGIDSMTVSEYGVREGAIRELMTGRATAWAR